MKASSIVLHALLQLALGESCLTATTQADDAIAFDYKTGIVGGYWSSTPEGGADFKRASEAETVALLNARNRGGLSPVIVWDSKLTGYFSVAVGANAQGANYVAVSQGSTQAEADARAVHILLRLDKMKRSDVVCRYFCYGSK
jgi:hypothetical protein